MSKKKTKKSNAPKTIDKDLASEVVENIVAIRKGNRQDRFYLYWLFGLKVNVAAKLAGYAESYGYRLTENFRNNPKTRARVEQLADLMPDTYRVLCKLRLPWVSEIEAKGLDQYDKDPKLAVTNPQLLRQVKSAAGVVTDAVVSPATIPVAVSIQIQNVLEREQQRGSEEVVTIESEPEENG